MFHDSWSKYDGSGMSIHIPTFLVHPPYGEHLIKLMEDRLHVNSEYEDVILKADIEIANNDATETLSYSLFYGSVLDLDE